jgi:hypothetical protein
MGPFWKFPTSRSLHVALAVFFALVVVSPGAGQWYTPQSDRDLGVTWVVETLGPSQVRILGNLQNLSGLPLNQAALRAEGLDPAGRVVSRAWGYVSRQVPPRGSGPFEVRLILAGTEQQYRVTIEYFEFWEPSRSREDRSP